MDNSASFSALVVHSLPRFCYIYSTISIVIVGTSSKSLRWLKVGQHPVLDCATISLARHSLELFFPRVRL